MPESHNNLNASQMHLNPSIGKWKMNKERLNRYYGNREMLELLITFCKTNKLKSLSLEFLIETHQTYNQTYLDYLNAGKEK